MPARPSSRRSPLPATAPAAPASNATAATTPTVVEPTLRLDADLFWEKYKLPLLAALLVVILGVVGTLTYQTIRDRRLAAASAQLAAAKTPEDFQRLIDSHAGTPAAADALLLLARAQAEKGDRGAAAKSLRTFTERFPQHSLAGGALMALAEYSAIDGKPDEALTLVRQVPQRYPNSYSAPLAMMAEASLLREQGKTEDARRVYQNIIATYRQSIAAQQAQQELRLLRNPSSPAPVTTTAAPVAPTPPATAPAAASQPTASAVPTAPSVAPSPAGSAEAATPAATATPEASAAAPSPSPAQP